MEKKRLFIQTFGCQMNVQDSQKMACLMQLSGYETTNNPDRAHLIIVNTCSIRAKAAQKAYSQLGRFRSLKDGNADLMIGVGGCLAQESGKNFFERSPYVDFVFGTHQIHRLPEIVADVEKNRRRLVETAFSEKVLSLEVLPLPPAGAVAAFVTIMQGCDNFCAYCVVPYLRGREKSRPLKSILREVEILADHGIREVTLLGQNVNSYGKHLPEKADFSELINTIGGVSGIGRIRFTTSHPKDLSQKLISCFGKVPSLCTHIHLPVQSGSNRVLRRMNRGYTAEEYREKVAALRHVCPEISITSDVIVGFPGETEKDFQETLDLMKEVRFDNLFSFQYSKRAGTAAACMDNCVDSGTKRERLKILQELQADHTMEKNLNCIGRIEEILVEGPSKNSHEDVTGRTRGNRIVNFSGETGLIGKTVSVRIVEAYPHSLRGRLEEQGGNDAH